MHILFVYIATILQPNNVQNTDNGRPETCVNLLRYFYRCGSIPSSSHASPTSFASTYPPESALPFSSPSPMAFPIPSSGSVKGVKSGYWLSSLAEKFPPSLILTSYFTHLFYAFVMPNATTYQLLITQPDDQWMGDFTATLHAKTPQANVFLSIGGAATGPDTFAIIACTPESREAFINSSISARKYGFDGLDLDWEFPNTQEGMSNLALLFKEWREAVERSLALWKTPTAL